VFERFGLCYLVSFGVVGHLGWLGLCEFFIFLGIWACGSSLCIHHVYLGTPYVFSIKFFTTYQKKRVDRRHEN
jgi:hypothetical protein